METLRFTLKTLRHIILCISISLSLSGCVSVLIDAAANIVWDTCVAPVLEKAYPTTKQFQQPKPDSEKPPEEPSQ